MTKYRITIQDDEDDRRKWTLPLINGDDKRIDWLLLAEGLAMVMKAGIDRDGLVQAARHE